MTFSMRTESAGDTVVHLAQFHCVQDVRAVLPGYNDQK